MRKMKLKEKIMSKTMYEEKCMSNSVKERVIVNLQQNTAITLIALIITIIVLLILAGVTLNMLMGENGIITKAQWAKWITEYKTVEEAEHLYELKVESQKYGSIEKKVTARGEEENQETNYAITNEKVEVESGSTLENTIKQINGANYEGELYKIDTEKLNLEDIKKEYALDINNGKIYDIKGHKKGDVVYHTPDIGINISGKDTEPPSNFTIEAGYNADEEQLEINVGEVKDNKSTAFEYEYHIKEVTLDEETGEATDTEIAEVVKTTTENSYYDEEIADGTYRIYVVVYDEARNSRKSDNEEIVTVKKPETVTTTASLTMTNQIVVTVGKTVTVQVIKNEGTDNEEKVSNTSFTWSMADTNVATVNTKGQVTGKTIGTTTLTATLKTDTSKTLTATVEVKNLITEIWTKADLEEFRDNVNTGSTYAGLEVKQMADINLEGDNSNQWTPIGLSTSKTFQGTYNGNNFKITGLYINATTASQGLFGCASGNSIIKNVNVENGYIYTTKCQTGGILAWGKNVTVDNCTFSGSVTTTGRNNTTYNWGITGGIVGNFYYTGTNKIINCTNYGTINGTYHLTGGIIGFCQKGEISNCKNYGEVVGKNQATGGIAGQIGIYNTNLKRYSLGNIDNCRNEGNVTGSGNSSCNVGGIVGGVDFNSTVINSVNNNAVICEGRYSSDLTRSQVGGIVGNMIYNGANKKVYNCTNNGTVTASYHICGGIVGFAQRGSVESCTNDGKISGKTNTGGISGATGRYDTINNINYRSSATIEKCINNGDIENTDASNYNIGGITGVLLNTSVIQNSGNTGNIVSIGKYSYESQARIGGIVGTLRDDSSQTVKNCYNTGNVTSTYKGAGGIVGRINLATHNLSYCYNTGNISAPTLCGGIVGYYGKGTVENNYYLENSATVTSGSVTDKGEAKKADEIKALINTDVWKGFLVKDKINNINKGYPIFNWQ